MMVRAQIRTDLIVAMKARETDRVMALRSVLAALDDAEAVEPSAAEGATEASGPIAGATAGVGSTEVPRRVLMPDEVQAVLQSEVAEREEGAAEYAKLGQAEAADRLLREAEILKGYLLLPGEDGA